MSSWYTSWLPALPSLNFAVPASIQGHFISFILKRSLGHLFKPGQLNSPQIDSQIGSGYVQINDLELDEPAINGYLQGTALVLETGTVQSVTARIPWPNPLTSTIGASVKSLHLKFRVVKITRGSHKAEADLAESVLSVAEDFVHDELTDQEEAGLWESIHSSAQHESEENAVPGGLDPFISSEEELQADPTGVSLFATLIERLLARFEFDAQDIQVSITDPDNVTLRFCLAEMQYSTTAQPDASLEGIRRTLTLKGIDVFTTNHLRPSIPSSPSTTRPSSPIREGSPSSEDGSPRSSNSSLDEETEMRMSQSIAVFPPRPVSPSESTSGSIYHSIVEQSRSFTSPQREAVPQPAIGTIDAAERRFMSFGSTPISIHLTTPSPGDVAADGAVRSPKENIKLGLQSGALAIAVLPWQIVGLSRLAEKLTSIPSSTPTQSEQPNSSPQSYAFEASIDLKGICILLLPSPESTDDVGNGLDDYFTHAFTPPALSVGYTRILVDTITGRATVSSSEISSQLSVIDVSVFQYFGKSSDAEGSDSRSRAIPVLITDPYLPIQYDKPHHYPNRGDPPDSSHSQPTLRTVDRRNPRCATFGGKLSHWRTRSQQTTPAKAPSTEGHGSCLSFSLHRSSTKRPRNQIKTEQRVQLDVAPLSIFVDLEMTLHSGGIFSFVDTLLLEQSSYERFFHEASDSPQALAQDTSDTEDESPFHDPPARVAPSSQGPSRTNGGQINSSTALKLAMIRVSVLVPSPPDQQARSGPLILDLHGIEVSNTAGTRQPQHQVRFDPAVSHYQQPQASGRLIAQVQCRRIVLGCSTASGESTTAILSIGSLTDGINQQGPSLLPVINVLLPDTNDTHPEEPKTTVNVDIPSIFASISKEQWDALQYWIDDLSQALERIGAASKELSESRESKNASMIGSRYFARSQRSSTYDSSKSLEVGIKLLASVNVTELYIRCNLPREDLEGREVRPFNVMGSDFSVSVEMHANGKLAATVSFMDALIQDTDRTGKPKTFLSLTSARSLTSQPRPLIKVRFISSVIPETTAKETKVSLSLCNFTFDAYPDIQWITDLIAFSKAPPGTFESVVPSERTCISLKIVDGSLRAFAPSHPGALVLSIGGLHFATDIVGDTTNTSFRLDISSLAILAIDNIRDAEQQRIRRGETDSGVTLWKTLGYALLAEISSTKLHYQENKGSSPEKQVLVDGTKLKIHACADTFASVGEFGADLASHFSPPNNEETATTYDTQPAVLSSAPPEGLNLTRSIDDLAFRRVPEIGGPTPDMIYDDLPTNLDYLDESFGAAAGLRELRDDDLDEFDIHDITTPTVTEAATNTGIISNIGGETIKMLHEGGISIVEGYYDDLPREEIDERQPSEDEALRVRIRSCDVSLLLYDGYDWPRTRKTIEEEVKEMRKRLAKIRQLVASGQTPEPVSEDTSALLFNSVYIGLHEDVDATEPDALIAAIDEELKDDFETGTQSSWQTLQHPVAPASAAPRGPSVRVHGKKLTRAKGPSIEFCLSGVNAELNKYGGNNVVVSRTFATVRDLEILDHIKTSTWKKFLTAMRSDSKGNVRETGANMVRIELHSVRPAPGHPSEEARLRAKILPLRLYVDQDAVDFLKKFFSFKDPNSVPKAAPTAPEKEAYIQMAEIFPIDLKLDYKPRRVDYRALREGRTIELMNFFHFDGAEMTLRHITLSGITGWPKLFEMLNDLWTPDVKATQLVEVISGVAPIRSMVNVGSGVADLVLLPISQYKKDGRIVRGVQKGATAFVKSTALEAIKMGARLATGTQVILEQAEGILGGEFEGTITAETVQPLLGDEFTLSHDSFDDDDPGELISKYAQQPADIKEGVQTAYKSLRRNLNSAAQTILAVPMEVYERSGNEGPVRSVIRAVPIAVLKPMIGATEAVSKTLLGLHNTLDPDVRHENEAKYKNR